MSSCDWMGKGSREQDAARQPITPGRIATTSVRVRLLQDAARQTLLGAGRRSDDHASMHGRRVAVIAAGRRWASAGDFFPEVGGTDAVVREQLAARAG